MNCNLTNKQREEGFKCRSWDCVPCKSFGASENDQGIIQTHLDNMKLKKELETTKKQLEEAVQVAIFYSDLNQYSETHDQLDWDRVNKSWAIQEKGQRARDFLAKLNKPLTET